MRCHACERGAEHVISFREDNEEGTRPENRLVYSCSQCVDRLMGYALGRAWRKEVSVRGVGRGE